ncbi:two-component sensor histidine kinase [Paenalkalicoccus suaedae]|uniref:histidine kinase n=1 Tax=Paenalkalicoccus suaedae TaxID=2592382 RepID=A0A859FHZ0_9BACI|nr:ATP-binding protein [Paenalkalicoccus suaedae]QKS72430.1 two-component sensor histidine kinase [Paenalkalicoccus suaedae]
MKSFVPRLSLRSKLLLFLLSMTALFTSLSFFFLHTISNVQSANETLVLEEVPELIWLSHWEADMHRKRQFVEFGFDNDFCCDFTNRYEQIRQDSFDLIREINGTLPDQLQSLSTQIRLMDFRIINDVQALLDIGNIAAARENILTTYYPQNEQITELIQSKREQVIASLEAEQNTFSSAIDGMLVWLIAITILGLGGSIWLSYWLSAKLTRPLENMQEKLYDISQGDYGLQMNEGINQPELQSLTASINQMSESLEASFTTITEEKEYRENVLNALPIGIVTADKERKEVFMNETARRYLGEVFQEDHPNQHRSSYERRFWNVFESEGTFHNIKIPIKMKETEQIFLTSQSPLHVEGTKDVGKVFYFVDITDTENLENKVKQAEKLALIGELAAGAAHEIRNPLAVIDGFLTLMNQSLEEEQLNKYHVPLLLKELERINFIIEEMLMLAKPSAPRFHKVKLETMMNDIIPLLKGQPNFAQINIEVDLEPVELDMDVEQLKQVFHNLIRNGAEAMDGKGTIYIKSARKNNTYCVDIIDNGPGIPTHIAQDIFAPFLTSKSRGTGLGLTIAQRIVDTHNGRLFLEETSSNGTTFRIELPID